MKAWVCARRPSPAPWLPEELLSLSLVRMRLTSRAVCITPDQQGLPGFCAWVSARCLLAAETSSNAGLEWPLSGLWPVAVKSCLVLRSAVAT